MDGDKRSNDMAKPKKDAKYLNVHIERDLYDKFDLFCKQYGQSKTAATELALRMYMTDIENKMKGNKADAREDV